MKIYKVLRGLLLLLSVLPVAVADVGFRQIKTDAIELGVWYPTDAAATAGQLGPFEVNYAFDAAPSAGEFPVVILSHGVHGRYRNHHLTASLLADNGFVVIAPQHTAEKRDGTPLRNLPHRAEELRTALNAALAVPALAAIMAADKLYAVGYSLGSATVLAAAGGTMDIRAISAHCRENGETDKNFCGRDIGWLKKAAIFIAIARSILLGDDDKPSAAANETAPMPFSKIAVVAPLGQGWQADSLASLSAPKLIIGLSDDEILPVRFHAHRLRDIFLPAQTRYEELAAHHFAFIAPFPKSLTDQEDIPVARDPAGFNRPAFLQKTNRLILTFLNPKENYPPSNLFKEWLSPLEYGE